MAYSNEKQKNLFLMCGAPGSGKSTWVRNQVAAIGTERCIHISRDVIRFALVPEGEEYFAREKDVFKEFIRQINQAIHNIGTENIFVDATHLNEKSRNKVLDCLDLDGVRLVAISFNLPLDICLHQNHNRYGTRSFVPQDAMQKMHAAYIAPTLDEKHKYAQIIHIQ